MQMFKSFWFWIPFILCFVILYLAFPKPIKIDIEIPLLYWFVAGIPYVLSLAGASLIYEIRESRMKEKALKEYLLPCCECGGRCNTLYSNQYSGRMFVCKVCDKVQLSKEEWNEANKLYKKYKLNTSATHKLQEFRDFGIDMDFTCVDLKEPMSDDMDVIASKATQIGPDVLVDDTTLDIEGADIGVLLKWKKDEIKNHIGKPATVTVNIGVWDSDEQRVLVYVGLVKGEIVEKRGEGHSYEPWFQPYGAEKTLGEEKPYQYNPRAKAISNLKRKKPKAILNPLYWKGKWQ
jgi:XTP/dITP diphosphohydrolase